MEAAKGSCEGKTNHDLAWQLEANGYASKEYNITNHTLVAVHYYPVRAKS
jgi:hypothetical protein